MLDQTALTLHTRFDPAGQSSTKALELGAGQHAIRVRLDSPPDTALSIRVEVPGPVVDELAPRSAEPGTRLTFQGEGYYGPLTVLSGESALANATAVSHAIAFADTVPGFVAAPLTLRTVYGSSTTPSFSPTPARPSLTAAMVGNAPLTSIGSGLSPIIIPEARYLDLKRGAQPTTPELQTAAAVLASSESKPEALGLFGMPGAGPITGDVFIVARDWRVGTSGAVETRDYFLAVGQLSGFSEFASLPAMAPNASSSMTWAPSRRRESCRPTP